MTTLGPRSGGRIGRSAAAVGERFRRPGTMSILFGSLAAGVGAYAFQLIGSRALGEQAYAPIGVLWTIHYLALTIVMVSIEAYVARTVTLNDDSDDAVEQAIRTIARWVAAVVIALGAAAWLLRASLFGDVGETLAIIVVVNTASYGAFVVIRGRLAGSSRYGRYAVATGTESLARVVVAVPVALVLPTADAIAWTMPVGPLAVVAYWLAIRNRLGAPLPSVPAGPVAGLATGSTTRYLVATTFANAVSQTLLAAGPLVLIPLGASAEEISVFFVTITAARIPLVFAFGGLLSRVLPPLTRVARSGDYARLHRIAKLTCAAAVALAAVAAAVGAVAAPPLVAIFFGAGFRPAAGFAALTAAGVVIATAALGMNQMLIAMGAERRLVVPWAIAFAAGVAAVAVIGGSPTMRVAAAFVLGEGAALAGLLVASLRTHHTALPALPPEDPVQAVPPQTRLSE